MENTEQLENEIIFLKSQLYDAGQEVHKYQQILAGIAQELGVKEGGNMEDLTEKLFELKEKAAE